MSTDMTSTIRLAIRMLPENFDRSRDRPPLSGPR